LQKTLALLNTYAYNNLIPMNNKLGGKLNPMVTKNKLKGFTIVELLIVIVVIGILAAITLVSFNGVTQRATKAANQSNAQSVISAAEAVYGETGTYPVANATAATMITNLNASVVKVPGTLAVSGTTTGLWPVGTSAVTQAYLFYMVATGTNAGKGICVAYWDPTLATPAPVWFYSGLATTGGGTSNSTATCI